MKKQYRRGTHRCCTPAQTLSKIKPYMASMGITRVANITGLDHIGIPVVTACRPNSRALSVAQGKGLDLDSAKASAVMEAMESFHAEYMELPLRQASYNELRTKYQVVDVTRLPQLSIGSYHHDQSLLWVQGQNLGSSTLEELSKKNNIHSELNLRQAVWVPFDTVHTNYTLPLPTDSGSFMMSTNGLASGNCIEEAVSHGIGELVERDSTSLWQLSGGVDGQPERMLDLTTVNDAHCVQILKKYQQADISVGVWDTSTDIGISSFYCTIIDREAKLMRPLYPASGAGCHPCREVALSRALTEAAQTRLTLMSGSRDDTGLDDYEGAQADALQTKVRHWLQAKKQQRDFTEIPNFNSGSFVADIDWMLKQLQNNGLDEVVVVDLSKTEFDISVVRVLIPGLEGISDLPGYQPGERAKALLRRPLVAASKQEMQQEIQKEYTV